MQPNFHVDIIKIKDVTNLSKIPQKTGEVTIDTL